MNLADMYAILILALAVPLLRWAVVPVLIAFRLGRLHERRQSRSPGDSRA
ncbi:MAG TPA: hypothetical protein VIX86_24660 [Streptosporangiaceae bacterium]